MADAVATSATTSSTTYTTVLTPASPGPAVTLTVPASGRVLVEITAGMSDSNNGQSCFTSFAMSGANTQATAADANAAALGGNAFQRASASSVLTGLNPGSATFTAQYKWSSGSATCTFSNRALWAIPLP